jgi:hypothetical protein
VGICSCRLSGEFVASLKNKDEQMKIYFCSILAAGLCSSFAMCGESLSFETQEHLKALELEDTKSRLKAVRGLYKVYTGEAWPETAAKHQGVISVKASLTEAKLIRSVIIKSLNHDDQIFASECLVMMLNLCDEFLPDLRLLMRSSDPSDRFHSAIALAGLGDRAAAALPELLIGLSDGDKWVVRKRCALALSQFSQENLKGKDTIKTMVEALGREENYECCGAELANAIAQFRDDATTDVAKLSKSDSWKVRSLVALTLGKTRSNNESVLKTLRELEGDENKEVLQHARTALRNLQACPPASVQDAAKQEVKNSHVKD